MFDRFFDWPVDISGLLSLLAPAAGSDSMIVNAIRTIIGYIFDKLSINGVMTMSIMNMVFE